MVTIVLYIHLTLTLHITKRTERVIVKILVHGGMKQKHLIVISVDALVYEDLEYAKELPVFGDILENGSLIKNQNGRVSPIIRDVVHFT